MLHLHVCLKCFKKWADNMIMGTTPCPHCAHIQAVKDEGQISKEACLKLGVYYRKI